MMSSRAPSSRPSWTTTGASVIDEPVTVVEVTTATRGEG
jgi:hypothetical protein